MTRTKLADRVLPRYCAGEEIMNMVTHIVGGGIGVIVLVLCCMKTAIKSNHLGVIGSSIYGFTMVCLYCISSIYHGLRAGTAKKVMQVLDHCTIYFLIAGTYTPILLVRFFPSKPILGLILFCGEWGLVILAATLTAIDLKRYQVFSMICYILMGWAIIFVFPIAWNLIGKAGFLLLLYGGIAYTIGAVLFGIGVKVPWMHSVFHIFVVLGTFLQFLAIYLYIL